MAPQHQMNTFYMANRKNTPGHFNVVKLAQYEPPQISESKKDDWVDYGANNDYFEFLIDRYIKSPTNNAVINNIVKLIYGKGLGALNADRKPNDYAQMVTLFSDDCMRQIISDIKMLGQCALQVIYSKDRKKIVEVYHIPIQLLRAEKCNDEGEIEAYYFSNDWSDVKKNPPERIMAFGCSKEETEILYVKPYSVGMKYYSYVDYQGGIPYTTLEEEIGNYLINEVQNGFSGTKVINFNNGVPDEDQRERITADVMAKLTGTGGKRTIVAFNHTETNKTTVDDISLNDAPNHYEYLADECMRKILLSHNVTSPLLFGVATTTGFGSNADELKNSFVLYDNMVIKPYRNLIVSALEKILGFNGINLDLYFKTLKPLEFTEDNGQVEPEEDEAKKSLKKTEKEFNVDLNKYGHKADRKWILIDEVDVTQDEDKEMDLEIAMAQEKANADKPKKLSRYQRLRQAFLISTGDSTPDEASVDDWIINGLTFITRYKYVETNAKSPKGSSRPFCKAMLRAELLYRKEDILQMEKDSVNPGFGPGGSDKYSILEYKGGPNCYHLWRRQTFVGLESDYPLDPQSSEAKQISTYRAEKYGYRIRNPFNTALAPILMPNQGYQK